jgi:hypothetical protein
MAIRPGGHKGRPYDPDLQRAITSCPAAARV